MTYSNYIIYILLLILLLSILLYKKSSFKEAIDSKSDEATSEENALKCPSTNKDGIDVGCYDGYIDKLTRKYNLLMSLQVPITFYAGNIEYSYKTETPLVVFSGGVPYIYVNMRLPYPEVGDKGDPGDPGPPGNTGSKGSKGKSGLSGYSGSSYSGFLNSNLSK
jgi:hypothetical protein